MTQWKLYKVPTYKTERSIKCLIHLNVVRNKHNSYSQNEIFWRFVRNIPTVVVILISLGTNLWYHLHTNTDELTDIKQLIVKYSFDGLGQQMSPCWDECTARCCKETGLIVISISTLDQQRIYTIIN